MLRKGGVQAGLFGRTHGREHAIEKRAVDGLGRVVQNEPFDAVGEDGNLLNWQRGRRKFEGFATRRLS